MTYRKWDIWRASLDPVIGSEQGKSRPVLIISEDDINILLNVINILPITSLKRIEQSTQMKHFSLHE